MAGLRQSQHGDPVRVPQSSHRQHVRLRLRHHFLRLCRTSDRLDVRHRPPSRRPTGLHSLITLAAVKSIHVILFF